MLVRDLLEILNRLDPYQKVRIVMTDADGEARADTEPPEVKQDYEGVIELIFSDE